MALAVVDLARLRRAFVLWALGLSLLAGAVVTLQSGYGLEQFGAIGMAARIASLAVVRELAPAVAASAAFFALVTWSHGVAEPELRSVLRVALLRISVTAFLALAIVAGIEALACAGVLRVAFGRPWTELRSAAAQTIVAGDLLVGLGAFAVNMALVAGLATLLLPWLARTRARLGVKIAATWAFVLLLRLVVWILFARPAIDVL